MDDTAQQAPPTLDGCVLIRRQAIFDEHERLVGYELLLDSGHPPADDDDGRGLVVSAVVDIGLRRIVGSRRAYITATPAVLANAGALRLCPEQVVLQVPEQPVDGWLIGALARLVQDGFAIGVGGWALDGTADDLLALASMVKVDFDFGAPDLTRLVARSAELHARGVTLIAGHVQTRGEYERCRWLGFDAFQGEYLGRSAPVAGRRTPTAGVAALAAVLRAEGPDAFEELERVICHDAGLAHRFLRVADCALYARRTRVRSVHDALARVGTETARHWALMTIVGGMADTRSPAARHFLGVGLHRARVCQLLARQRRDACPDRAFSVGLLSILPVLTREPVDELLCDLPLDERLAGALADHLGAEGQMLAAILAHESGQRANAENHPRLLAAVSRVYADALLWADDHAGRLG